MQDRSLAQTSMDPDRPVDDLRLPSVAQLTTVSSLCELPPIAAATAGYVVDNNGHDSAADHRGDQAGRQIVPMEIKIASLHCMKSRKPVKYKECLKNHAATLGGHALDGCGEFLPSGEEGTIEALRCAACDCHRNFHRREVEGERELSRFGHHLHLPPHHPPLALPAPPGTLMLRALHPPMIVGALGRTAEHPDHEQEGLLSSPLTNYQDPAGASGMLRFKRFRTKFTSEQKERMWEFSERLGWRIQKQNEQEVKHFCSEIGVKRHVLKVWMHNNKNTFGNKPAT